MKTIVIIFVIALLGSLANAQEAQVKLMCDKKQSSITYSMNHPLHAWTGVSKEINSVILADNGRNHISQVAVSVKVSSFDSQNANRDSHMIETTEAIKYPSITFTSTSIKEEKDVLKITGKLTFHGVTQVISFDAQKKIVGGKAEVTGNLVAKMSQFKIESPSLMGFSTDDDIKIAFKMVY